MEKYSIDEIKTIYAEVFDLGLTCLVSMGILVVCIAIIAAAEEDFNLFSFDLR